MGGNFNFEALIEFLKGLFDLLKGIFEKLTDKDEEVESAA